MGHLFEFVERKKKDIMGDMNEIGQAFVEHYYSTFDEDRSELGPLYTNESMLSFEGDGIMGANDIVQYLVELKFETVKHVVNTMDVQPSASGGLIVFVLATCTSTTTLRRSPSPSTLRRSFSSWRLVTPLSLPT